MSNLNHVLYTLFLCSLAGLDDVRLHCARAAERAGAEGAAKKIGKGMPVLPPVFRAAPMLCYLLCH